MDKKVRKNWDTPWKEVLDIFFREFLEFCYPNIATDIDWSKPIEFLDQELHLITQEAEIGKKVVDKLTKVWRKSGEEVWVLLHLEVQAQRDAGFSERMFVYRYRLFDRYRVPISSIAILIDQHRNWRPNYYEAVLWDAKLHYQFNVLKVLDYKESIGQLEASSNPFATILLVQLEASIAAKQNEEQRLASKVNLTRRLYEKGFNRTQVIGLYRFLDWIIRLPKPLVLEYEKEICKIEGEKQMTYVTSIERLGLERGLERGLEQGLEQGRIEGELTIVTRLLERKFSSLPEHYQKRLRQADAKTLFSWAERLLEAKSLAEVFN